MKGLIIAIPLLGSLAFGQSVTTSCTEFLGNVRCTSNDWAGNRTVTNCNTFLGNTRCRTDGLLGSTLTMPPLVRPNAAMERGLDGLRRSLETRSLLDSMKLQQEIMRREIESYDRQKLLEKEKRNRSWKWIENADELSY